MKIFKIIVLLLILTASANIFAQEAPEVKKETNKNETQTLFGGVASGLSFSGYGALDYKYTKIGEEYSSLGGFRGGLIIDNNYVIGAAFYGLAHENEREKFSGVDYTGTEPYMEFGYGGLLLDYHIMPKSLINFSVGCLIGGGSLDFYEDEDDHDHDRDSHGDKFFVAEPEVHMYLNIAKFCRLGVGASYRFVNGIDSTDFENKDFSGLSGSVSAQFGWF